MQWCVEVLFTMRISDIWNSKKLYSRESLLGLIKEAFDFEMLQRKEISPTKSKELMIQELQSAERSFLNEQCHETCSLSGPVIHIFAQGLGFAEIQYSCVQKAPRCHRPRGVFV